MNKLSFVITGGGTSAIGKMLQNGGASKWFKCAYVPYSTDMVDEFIGYTPKQYVSFNTASDLASRISNKTKCATIASTAKLMSPDKPLVYPDGTKRVSCAYLFMWSDNYKWEKYVELKSETRLEQEEELSNIIIEAAENKLVPDTGYIGPKSIKKNPIFFSGSFNPVTKNHLEIASIVEKAKGIKPVFEISVTNVDKDTISYQEVLSRAERINEEGYALLFHDAPLFFDKAKNIDAPCSFVIGMDTLKRINERHTEEELKYFRDMQIKFLVFHRDNVEPFVNKIYDICEFFPEYIDNGWSSTKERKNNEL